MTAETTYEVKPPSAVLAEDVICQSFIQSSSTLAYACLVLRRGRHDLAAHVLHSLEQKPASRFKDMVFYLQSQIGIETGDFAAVKRRLVLRAHQHPNDMVALSLLASCVHLEREDWLRRNPALAAGGLPGSADSDTGPVFVAGASAVRDAGDGPEAADAAPEAMRGESGSYRTLAVPTVPSARAGFPSGPAPLPRETEPPGGFASTLPDDDASGDAAFPDGLPFSASPSADFGLYQGLAADPNTQALSLWNAAQRTQKSACRKPALEPLTAILPQILPSGVAAAVRALEGGEILKVCFSFRDLTVTTLHAGASESRGADSLGLLTGSMNQSLLTMVRAENIFLKGSAARAGVP